MSRKFLILLCLIAVLPWGCTMAPQYNRPKAPVPETWPSGSAYKEAKAAARRIEMAGIHHRRTASPSRRDRLEE